MRGKGDFTNQFPGIGGITPAYAGKSNRLTVAKRTAKDHPRVCGEKCPTRARNRNAAGSPPRMRGKVFAVKNITFNYRITPAYAGKSCLLNLSGVRLEDHPRVCGEKTKKIHYNPIMLLNKTKFPLT